MKKKMITLVLAIAMLSTMFVGCGEDTTTNPNENEVLDTDLPNTTVDDSVDVPDTDTSIPEETPIVEGVFAEHSNGWYRCEPLENGMYKYEIYSSDMGTTYSIELPVFSEDMDFSYKWSEDKTTFEMTFLNDEFCFQINPCTYDEVTKENYGNNDSTSVKTESTYFEHYIDTPDLDVYMYNVTNNPDMAKFYFYEYDYTNKCRTSVSLLSTIYTWEEHMEYAKTFSKTPYDTNGRYNNLISSIDTNVEKTFGVKDISSKVKEKNLNMTVVGYYDWIRTSYVDPTLYKELILTVYNSDYSSISKDTVVEIVKELFGDKELYVYGTEDALSEFPTYTTESTPYFYYYVDENLYGVVSMKDDGIFYLEIKYFKK